MALKYGFDRILATGLLVLVAPTFVCVALAVRLSSPGPVFSRQRRIGRDGKEFDLYKFRLVSLQTKRTDLSSDSSALELLLGGKMTPKGIQNNHRRNAIGRFIRRSALDELPQMLNVLRGEMSLIGPRPERPRFVEPVNRSDDRHRVKPGMTGWAQVHGLRGQTSRAKRVEWDNYYSTHWSLRLDLKILVLTLMALFRSR
jgi:lipopolysaccharide/colanic/teichoic acid biosynthesis glycosyltransferase